VKGIPFKKGAGLTRPEKIRWGEKVAAGRKLEDDFVNHPEKTPPEGSMIDAKVMTTRRGSKGPQHQAKDKEGA